MKIEFKAGKVGLIAIIPTIIISHNPYFKIFSDWAIELHFLAFACGVNFYNVDKQKFL